MNFTVKESYSHFIRTQPSKGIIPMFPISIESNCTPNIRFRRRWARPSTHGFVREYCSANNQDTNFISGSERARIGRRHMGTGQRGYWEPTDWTGTGNSNSGYLFKIDLPKGHEGTFHHFFKFSDPTPIMQMGFVLQVRNKNNERRIG